MTNFLLIAALKRLVTHGTLNRHRKPRAASTALKGP